MSASRSTAPLRTADEAARWLEGLIDVERTSDAGSVRLGLEPVRALLARAGNPEGGLPVLHVAGSKGKGSTALLAEALLRALGERVGTFTSPHLESWTERFRIDGAPVSGNRLAAAVEALRPHVEALRESGPVPSWFDVTTAVAFRLFREAGVDRAVIEVGLGGRLDSTNVVDPQVACITSIELEHVRILGSRLEDVAREKAGIVKPGRPVVTGALPSEAAGVVVARARECDAPLSRLGQEFSVSVQRADLSGLTLSLRDGDLAFEATLPLLGAHHAANVALAVAAVRRLPGVDREALEAQAPEALAGIRLPARSELFSRKPLVVVDAAHTPASARALARALACVPHARRRLVVSISSDKDVAGVLEPLLDRACEVTVTRAEPSRSLDPRSIAGVVRGLAPEIAMHAIPNPFVALRAARERLGPDELLCVAGSVYLAGLARRVLAS